MCDEGGAVRVRVIVDAQKFAAVQKLGDEGRTVQQALKTRVLETGTWEKIGERERHESARQGRR